MYQLRKLRGLVKLKKVEKFEKKLGFARPDPPTPLSIFFLGGGTCAAKKHPKNT